MIFLKVFFQIFRNIARLLACFVDISSACLLHDIDIADELAIFTDREMQRRDLLAIKFGKILYYFTIADIIHVHICYKDHTR